jgi:hypothetical protein
MRRSKFSGLRITFTLQEAKDRIPGGSARATSGLPQYVSAADGAASQHRLVPLVVPALYEGRSYPPEHEVRSRAQIYHFFLLRAEASGLVGGVAEAAAATGIFCFVCLGFFGSRLLRF